MHISSFNTYRGKMAAIWQTTFSYAISCMKTLLFWFTFHWNLSLTVKLKNVNTDLDNVLEPNWWQAITLTNDDLVYSHTRHSASMLEVLQGVLINSGGLKGPPTAYLQIKKRYYADKID